jgi:hypothetical protein
VSKKSKPKSRWNAGNERYPPKLDLSKYRSQPGWHNGARVTKR